MQIDKFFVKYNEKNVIFLQFCGFLCKKTKKIRVNEEFFVSLHAKMDNVLINIGGRLLSLEKPLVMAIVNVTPDSFAKACRSLSEEEIRTAVRTAIDEGADILDIGGYSTRPGAEEVSEAEEWERVEKALRVIRGEWPDFPVSVDTFRASVAKRAITEYGVQMINDISGGELDTQMYETIAETGVAYVLMHMRGTPATMASMTDYSDMMSEVLGYFAERVDRLHQLGVKDIVIDPGFGFAKTLEQNYELLRRMGELTELGFPILAGVSRKSMIYRALGTQPTDDETLIGTAVVNMLALRGGAKILRVHDVREAVQTIKIYELAQ